FGSSASTALSVLSLHDALPIWTMPSLPTVSWKFSPVISFVAMCFPFRFTRCVFPPGVSARRGEYSSFLSAPCNVGCSLLYSTVGAQNMSYFVFYEHSERIFG